MHAVRENHDPLLGLLTMAFIRFNTGGLTAMLLRELFTELVVENGPDFPTKKYMVEIYRALTNRDEPAEEEPVEELAA
jgi:hypothetical protein